MPASEAGGPDLPPLFHGEAADDPVARAIARSRAGTDPGLVTYRIRPDRLSAALVLAPECSLEDAMAMVLAAANGLADGFGALAPSEVACQFRWPGSVLINGARCGGLTAAASTRDPDAEPDWLVIGLDLPFFAPAGPEPGATPGETTLWEEGCADIAPRQMLESWARHTLHWIHTWQESGLPPLARDFRGRMVTADPVAVELPGGSFAGSVLGLDDRGGLLLKSGGRTLQVPLSAMLEQV